MDDEYNETTGTFSQIVKILTGYELVIRLTNNHNDECPVETIPRWSQIRIGLEKKSDHSNHRQPNQDLRGRSHPSG